MTDRPSEPTNSEQTTQAPDAGADSVNSKPTSKLNAQTLQPIYASAIGLAKWINKTTAAIGRTLAKYLSLFGRWALKTLKNSKVQKITGMSCAGLVMVALMVDYVLTTHVRSVTNLYKLDARKDSIVIRYSRPVRAVNFRSEHAAVKVDSQLSEDGLTETHKLVYPTTYSTNKLAIVPIDQSGNYDWLGIFKIRGRISFSTGIEKLSIAGLKPAHQNPAPAELGNRISVVFDGEFNALYAKGGDIAPDKLDYVKMTPTIPGHFRWTQRNELSFFFIHEQEKPKFDTEYKFEIFPEKILAANNDPEKSKVPAFQKWVGKQSVFALKTSSNDVFVKLPAKKIAIGLWDKLHIEFSGDMTNVLNVGKVLLSDEIPASISPAIVGKWKWINTKTLEFSPKQEWPARVDYRVTLKPEMNQEQGRHWRGGAPALVEFNIKPLTQAITEKNITGKDVDVESALELNFTYPLVAEHQLRTRTNNAEKQTEIPVTIAPFIAGDFYWTKTNQLRFKPKERWQELTKYSVKINSNYKLAPRFDWDAKKDGGFEFETIEDTVTANYFATPENRIEDEEFAKNQGSYSAMKKLKTEERLWIQFSRDLGKYVKSDADMSKLVQFSPEIKGQYRWLSTNLLEFVPDHNWAQHTHYQLSIDRKLLYHSQQHFARNTARLSFFTGANIVAIQGITKTVDSFLIAPDQTLELKFSKNMKTLINIGQETDLSKMSADLAPLKITPALDAELLWKDARTMVIRAKGFWNPESKYMLELNDKILAHPEAQFEFEKKISLTTLKNRVAIENFSPAGRVPADAKFEISFTRPIKPKATKLGEALSTRLFVITPPLAGTWRWISDSKLEFTPKSPLPRSVLYSFDFKPDEIEDKQFSWFQDRDKKTHVYPDTITKVHNDILRVLDARHTNVFNEKDYQRERFVMEIELSDSVSLDNFKKHFSIWYHRNAECHTLSGPVQCQTGSDNKDIREGITYTVKTDNPDPSKSFYITSEWIKRPDQDRSIHYAVTEGLKPVNANLGIEKTVERSFVQNRALAIKINGVDWRHVHKGTHAAVRINAPLHPQMLQKLLKVYQVRPDKSTLSVDYSVTVDNQSSQDYAVYNVVLNRVVTAGEKYKFTLPKGILALNGNYSVEETQFVSTVNPYNDELRFEVNGNFLSAKDMKHVPISIANHKNIKIMAYRLYKNNLNYYLNNTYGDTNDNKLSKLVYEQIIDVEKLINAKLKTSKRVNASLDLSQLIEKNPHGIYLIKLAYVKEIQKKNAKKPTKIVKPTDEAEESQATDAEGAESTESEEKSAESDDATNAENTADQSAVEQIIPTDARWLTATDIGLHARYSDDSVMVWATSLKTGAVNSGVTIKVFDSWNQEVGSATTNAEGLASIKLPASTQARHVFAIQGNDLSFIEMTNHKVDLQKYDTEGLSSTALLLRAYLYTSRGVYRPGETVNLMAVVRDQHERFPGIYPFELKITDPNGNEVVTEKLRNKDHGVINYDLTLDGAAPSGHWNAVLYWKKDKHQTENIGSYRFQVEEFIPNKIDVFVKNEPTVAIEEGRIAFRVNAEHKFGGPARGLTVKAQIELRQSHYTPPGQDEFKFGGGAESFTGKTHEFEESKLSDDDRADKEFTYELPEGLRVSQGVTAFISATVLDDAQRGVTKYAQAIVLMYKRYVGIRKITEGSYELAKPIEFEVSNVFADGKAVAKQDQKISIKVYKQDEVAFFKKNPRGYYRYVTEPKKVLFKELANPLNAANRFNFTPTDGGRYLIEVKDHEGGQLTQFDFDVESDKLIGTLEQDKVVFKVLNKALNIGDTLEVELYAPFAGKLLLSTERDRLYVTRVLDVQKGRNLVKLPVEKTFYPNVYISAALIRPIRQEQEFAPVFAYGLINIAVQDKERTPGVVLLVDGAIEPNKPVTAKIQITGLVPTDKPVYFTLSAVDTGILDLTDFKLESIAGYFRAKIKLEIGHFSMYHLIAPFIAETKIKITPSGDEGSKKVKRRMVNPDAQKRVKPVALWSGLQKLDANGNAQISFNIPDFNGSLRFQLVAYGERKYAMVTKEVRVFDKLIIRPGIPRFLGTGDEFIVPVTIYNKTGKPENIRVKITTDKSFTVSGSTEFTKDVANEREIRTSFKVKTLEKIGLGKVTLTATAGTHTRSKTTELPIRYPLHPATLGDSGLVTAQTPRSLTLPPTLKRSTLKYNLTISQSPLAEYRNGLGYLLGYPHGCVEQITSKTFPLLHFADIAESAGFGEYDEEKRKSYVNDAIRTLLSRQRALGDFSYWSGEHSYNDYASVYASHLLVEARNKGYKVGDQAWERMVGWLTKANAKNKLLILDMELHVYRLYVLALAKQKILSELNYVYDNYLENMLPADKARLALAYIEVGQKAVAKDILAGMQQLSAYDTLRRDTGGNFTSNIRSLALVLEAYASIDATSPQINLIMKKIKSFSHYGMWGNTQENAVAFIAIGKAYRQEALNTSKARVKLADGSVRAITKTLTLDDTAFGNNGVLLEVEGEGRVSFAWNASGVEIKPTATFIDKGIKVRKRYLDSKGVPVDMQNVKQGQLVVVELSVESLSGSISNVAITDLLPAGLEIENERLTTTARLNWMQSTLNKDYIDIRDDRIDIYATVHTHRAKHYYLTRAVSAGTFSVPEIRADAMYDPDLFGWADRGTLRILPNTNE